MYGVNGCSTSAPRARFLVEFCCSGMKVIGERRASGCCGYSWGALCGSLATLGVEKVWKPTWSGIQATGGVPLSLALSHSIREGGWMNPRTEGDLFLVGGKAICECRDDSAGNSVSGLIKEDRMRWVERSEAKTHLLSSVTRLGVVNPSIGADIIQT